MERIAATQLVSCGATVGEGPVYDPATEALFWVDIPVGRLWRYDIRAQKLASREVGEPLGCLAPIEGGGWLLAARRGLLVLAGWNGSPVLWRPIEPDLPTQSNDGKCDRHGRFYVGTASHDPAQKGSLYRVDIDGTVHGLIGGIGMANGLDWTPDERSFYYVDSLSQAVTRYDWEAERGVPRSPAPFVAVPRTVGIPDGLTVDSEGCVWLAVWGAGEVRRYDSTGRLIGVVSVPTPNVSSCTFGGDAMSDLYITTAAQGTNESVDPSAGHVFVASTTTTGQHRKPFPRRAVAAWLNGGSP